MRREANGGEQSLSLIPLLLSAPDQLRQQRDTLARAAGRQCVQQRLPVGAVTLASFYTSAPVANALKGLKEKKKKQARPRQNIVGAGRDWSLALAWCARCHMVL